MLAVAAVLAVAAALADCVVAVVGGGPIVTSVFGAHNPRADAMSKNDDDDYQAKQRKYKRTTVELLSHDLFKAQLQISFIAKGPLTHFLAWAQKEIKRDNEARLMAERRGEANVGQTFLSNLVATKARAIWEEMSALLSDASVMDKWVPVWAVCGGPAVTSARALIISLVTRSAAEWKWRFLDRCESFPLCLLGLLEEPQAAPSPRRMEIAKRLLGTCRRCVERDRKQRSIPMAKRRVERSCVCPHAGYASSGRTARTARSRRSCSTCAAAAFSVWRRTGCASPRCTCTCSQCGCSCWVRRKRSRGGAPCCK